MNFTKLLADIKIADILKTPSSPKDPKVLNTMRNKPPITTDGMDLLLESTAELVAGASAKDIENNDAHSDSGDYEDSSSSSKESDSDNSCNNSSESDSDTSSQSEGILTLASLVYSNLG